VPVKTVPVSTPVATTPPPGKTVTEPVSADPINTGTTGTSAATSTISDPLSQPISDVERARIQALLTGDANGNASAKAFGNGESTMASPANPNVATGNQTEKSPNLLQGKQLG
jgi:hypothetical protein